MALIHEDSMEILKSELELFAVPPTQTSIEETRFVEYYPTTSLGHGPVEFHIPPNDKEYLDLQNSFLYMKLRILDEDGEILKPTVSASDKSIPEKSIVFPINYIHATCFKTVEVLIGNKNCSSNDTMYPYRAYLETLLSYGKITKEEQLVISMFYRDKAPIDEHTDAVAAGDGSKNNGARSRFLRTNYSTPVETLGRIHSEIFSQPKLLIGDVSLTIKFHRADTKFALMGSIEDQKYIISIDTAILFICQKRISESIREAHRATLQKKNIIYPLRKVQMKFFTRGSNRSDLTEANFVNGVLPRKIVIGLVTTEAFNGHLHHNPFNFKHFNVKSIILRKNGETVPFQAIETDYNNKCSVRGYLSLLEGTSNLFRNRSIDIRPIVDFPQGYALYAFDLTPDHSGHNSFDLIQQGNISLEIKLDKASETGICIVAYLEYDALLEIDSHYNVIYEQ